MSKDDNRMAVAKRVAEQLFDAEAKLDEALSAYAALIAMMPRARIEANLSATVGQAAFADFVTALEKLTEARGVSVAGHNKLARVQALIGVRELATGGWVDKDELGMPRPLSAVANAA